MIDNTKFKYHLGDIIQDLRYKGDVQGIIVGYYFLKGFNNYYYPYGYCISTLGSINSHSGISYGYHANGNQIHPMYANSILYTPEKMSCLVRTPRILIYKLLLV